MTDEVDTREEDEVPPGGLPQTDERLVVPELDLEGGTKFVYGGTDEEASAEEWAAQQGGGTPEEEAEVEGDEE
jgi:hypothetical protein